MKVGERHEGHQGAQMSILEVVQGACAFSLVVHPVKTQQSSLDFRPVYFTEFFKLYFRVFITPKLQVTQECAWTFRKSINH